MLETSLDHAFDHESCGSIEAICSRLAMCTTGLAAPNRGSSYGIISAAKISHNIPAKLDSKLYICRTKHRYAWRNRDDRAASDRERRAHRRAPSVEDRGSGRRCARHADNARYLGKTAGAERGAQLRKVELLPPRHVIAKNTVEALQSGLLFGVASHPLRFRFACLLRGFCVH